MVNSSEIYSFCDETEIIINVPFPGDKTAELVDLVTGSCEQNSDGIRTTQYHENSTFSLVIQMDSCDLGKTEKTYESPISKRSKRSTGLFQVKIDFLLAEQLINGMLAEIKNYSMIAECGKKIDDFEVKFDFSDVKTELEDCDGPCVIPGYDNDVKFAVEEYTDNSYSSLVEPGNERRISGEYVYLSIKATEIYRKLMKLKKC